MTEKNSTEPIISIRHVWKYFGQLPALQDVSLDIAPGERVVIIGPSGSGKSTLLRSINRLEEIDGGSIIVNGQDINDRSNNINEMRRNLGMVFQQFNLFPHKTVLQNLTLAPRKLLNIPKAEAETMALKLLKKVGISDKANVYPAMLSGGQQQRVAIARALVTNPAIICMDEPLSNLDAKLRVQLRNELKKMQKDFGITTIYVTHDQEEALTLSDRIAVFNKGVIEQIGTPNEVYNHSATEFVCNFIGDINRLETPLVQHLNDRGAGLDAAMHNYIRLERLHVNVQPRDGELALSGVVESREYYGLYIKYYITVEGQTLKVIEKNDGVNIYEPAQQVSVVINPAHVMAYEAGEEAAHA